MGHLQREARNRRWALTGGRVRCATACTDCTCLLLRHGPRRSWKQAQSVCARRFVDWRLTQLDLMSDESLGSERKPGSRKVTGASAPNQLTRLRMWSAGQSNGSTMPKAPPTLQCFISFQMLSQ